MNGHSKDMILIVDDINENLQLLATYLNRQGYEIALANSGKSALEVLGSLTPDLILLDIMMPEMDGYETCERIKSKNILKDIPIIFLTAKTDNDSILNAFEKGAVDYITKPVNVAELLVRIKTHINLKHSQEILIQYNDRLQTLLKDRAEFMGIAAHDMKNPLNAIIAYSDLLINTLNTTKFSKQDTVSKLSIIKNSASFMLDSVTELLNHDIIEAGYRELNFQHYSPMKIVQTILINNLLWAESKSIRIKYIKYPDFDVLLDEDATRDIYQNIVSNALKYSNHNSNVWVSLSRFQNNGEHYLRFSVKDKGQGISKDEQSKLFQKMQKLSSRPTAGEGSTGMGLYIVKKLTELHGGRVDVKTELGKGTEFIVDLPIEDFTNLNYLKYYDNINYEKDFSIFGSSEHTDKKKWNYLEDLTLELESISKEKVKINSERLMDSYYYIRKTNVINDIRKFASEIRNFGEEIKSVVFLEYGDELNKLAITFDIENLPALLDFFPILLNTALKK